MKQKRNIPLPTEFGQNLRNLRRRFGISQAALAEKLGINRQRVASYETGTVEPKAQVFLSVCNFFHVDPVHMLSKNVQASPEDNAYLPQNLDRSDTGTISSKPIDNLRAETDNFERILEGYEVFHGIKPVKDEFPDHATFLSIYEDLLEIMHLLVELNHEFFSALKPSD